MLTFLTLDLKAVAASVNPALINRENTDQDSLKPRWRAIERNYNYGEANLSNILVLLFQTRRHEHKSIAREGLASPFGWVHKVQSIHN